MSTANPIVTLMIVAAAALAAWVVNRRYPVWFMQMSRMHLVGSMMRALLVSQAFAVVALALVCLRIEFSLMPAYVTARELGLFREVLVPIVGTSLVSLAWAVYVDRSARRKWTT